jgi:MFS family permease
MSLFKIDRNPTDRTLRQFAAAACVALPPVGWMLSRSLVGVGCGAAVATVMVAAAILRPRSLRIPYVGLSYATAPIGLVVGEILTVVMYFGVFAPIGFFLRATGRDPLERRFRPEAKSYWTPKRPARSAAAYLRQF